MKKRKILSIKRSTRYNDRIIVKLDDKSVFRVPEDAFVLNPLHVGEIVTLDEIEDYDVKMRAITKFLGAGDKVKVTMRFRGREMAHQELGMDVLMRVKVDLDEVSKVEQMPKLEGRQMTMVVAPR